MDGKTEKCPQCGGHAQGLAVMCGPANGAADDEMKCQMAIQACEFCGGLGIVEAQVAERYRRGDAIRRLRVKSGLTQRQQAYILRISPMLLNDIEHGRAEWLAWVNQKLLAEYGYI